MVKTVKWETFVQEVREEVVERQDWMCACGCGKPIPPGEAHHVLENTKVNRQKYPAFLQSKWNCKMVRPECHDSGKIYKWKIDERVAAVIEMMLQERMSDEAIQICYDVLVVD